MGNLYDWATERAMNVAENARDLATTPVARGQEGTNSVGYDWAANISTNVYGSPKIKISNVGNSQGTYYQSQRNYQKSEH